MIQIFSTVIKEFKLLLRDIPGLALLFLMPAMFIFILSIALQGTFSSPDKKEKLELLIVNDDNGKMGNNIIEGLEKTGYFKAVTKLKNNNLTLNNAKEELKKGKYRILIHIPENTTKALNFKNNAEILILVDPVLPNDFASQITNAIQTFVHLSIIENIGNISINIFKDIKQKRINEITSQINNSNKKKTELLDEINEIKNAEMDEGVKEAFLKLAYSSIKELDSNIKEFTEQLKELNEQDMDQNEYVTLVKKNTGLLVKQLYYYAESDTELFPTSVQQNVPGWTIFALFWIVQIISINIIAERQSGVFKRIMISPISTFKYIVGKLLPFFIINILQAVVMFCIGLFILPLFGCPQLIITNLWGIIILTICISLVAISFSLFIATICKTIFVAATFSALLVIILSVVGGIMVPKFVMPNFMKIMSLFTPHGWALDGYLNIFVRNYGIIQILPNILILLGFATVLFLLSLLNFKKILRTAK